MNVNNSCSSMEIQPSLMDISSSENFDNIVLDENALSSPLFSTLFSCELRNALTSWCSDPTSRAQTIHSAHTNVESAIIVMSALLRLVPTSGEQTIYDLLHSNDTQIQFILNILNENQICYPIIPLLLANYEFQINEAILNPEETYQKGMEKLALLEKDLPVQILQLLFKFNTNNLSDPDYSQAYILFKTCSKSPSLMGAELIHLAGILAHPGNTNNTLRGSAFNFLYSYADKNQKAATLLINIDVLSMRKNEVQNSSLDVLITQKISLAENQNDRTALVSAKLEYIMILSLLNRKNNDITNALKLHLEPYAKCRIHPSGDLIVQDWINFYLAETYISDRQKSLFDIASLLKSGFDHNHQPTKVLVEEFFSSHKYARNILKMVTHTIPNIEGFQINPEAFTFPIPPQPTKIFTVEDIDVFFDSIHYAETDEEGKQLSADGINLLETFGCLKVENLTMKAVNGDMKASITKLAMSKLGHWLSKKSNPIGDMLHCVLLVIEQMKPEERDRNLLHLLQQANGCELQQETAIYNAYSKHVQCDISEKGALSRLIDLVSYKARVEVLNSLGSDEAEREFLFESLGSSLKCGKPFRSLLALKTSDKQIKLNRFYQIFTSQFLCDKLYDAIQVIEYQQLETELNRMKLTILKPDSIIKTEKSFLCEIYFDLLDLGFKHGDLSKEVKVVRKNENLEVVLNNENLDEDEDNIETLYLYQIPQTHIQQILLNLHRIEHVDPNQVPKTFNDPYSLEDLTWIPVYQQSRMIEIFGLLQASGLQPNTVGLKRKQDLDIQLVPSHKDIRLDSIIQNIGQAPANQNIGPFPIITVTVNQNGVDPFDVVLTQNLNAYQIDGATITPSPTINLDTQRLAQARVDISLVQWNVQNQRYSIIHQGLSKTNTPLMITATSVAFPNLQLKPSAHYLALQQNGFLQINLPFKIVIVIGDQSLYTNEFMIVTQIQNQS